MSFTIITDSSCNLPDAILQQYQIDILSLSYFAQEKQYLSYENDKNADLQAFYQLLREGEHITTSCVTPQACMDLFTQRLEQGKDILYIGFSSGLSATYQTASTILLQTAENYPQRQARCVDSLAAALGQGLLVVLAARLREQGKSMTEVYNWILDNRMKICHWVTVDDLFFLHRGGRVSKAAAIIGSAVGMRPIIHVDNDGHLAVVQKVRGRKASLQALVSRMEQWTDNPALKLIGIAHGDCEQDAQYVRQLIEERYHAEEFLISCLEPVIATHAGPGTIALFFVGGAR